MIDLSFFSTSTFRYLLERNGFRLINAHVDYGRNHYGPITEQLFKLEVIISRMFGIETSPAIRMAAFKL